VRSHVAALSGQWRHLTSALNHRLGVIVTHSHIFILLPRTLTRVDSSCTRARRFFT
jgi:hypothetical protein